MMRTLCFGLLLTVLGACGGRVIVDPGAGGSSSSEPGNGNGGNPGAGGKSPDMGSDGHLPTHDLGACAPGFARSQFPNRACPWLTEAGQCFDTQDAACACICNAGNNLCWSAFPEPGTPTLMHCN